MVAANSEGFIDIANLKEALKITEDHLKVSTKIRSTEQRGNMAMDHALKGQRRVIKITKKNVLFVKK